MSTKMFVYKLLPGVHKIRNITCDFAMRLIGKIDILRNI